MVIRKEHFTYKIVNINDRFLSAVFSNIFAFGWDIVIDWGLIQLETDRALFRKDLHFSDPFCYVMAVGINGLLRLLKIGSHLYHIHPFCVDLSEIARRWTWVVFRFENEWIKRSYIDMDPVFTTDAIQLIPI
jgi:hypothetical protein